MNAPILFQKGRRRHQRLYSCVSQLSTTAAPLSRSSSFQSPHAASGVGHEREGIDLSKIVHRSGPKPGYRASDLFTRRRLPRLRTMLCELQALGWRSIERTAMRPILPGAARARVALSAHPSD